MHCRGGAIQENIPKKVKLNRAMALSRDDFVPSYPCIPPGPMERCLSELALRLLLSSSR